MLLSTGITNLHHVDGERYGCDVFSLLCSFISMHERLEIKGKTGESNYVFCSNFIAIISIIIHPQVKGELRLMTFH